MAAATTILGLLPLAAGGSKVGGLFYFLFEDPTQGGVKRSAVVEVIARRRR